MVISLMYHHINGKEFSNDLKTFEEHIIYLKNRYIFVTPDDELKKGVNYICLTFDDAYFDFYHFVYPLLKKYNIKAMLAVPVRFIDDNNHSIEINKRLLLNHSEIYQDKNYIHFGSFCSWRELKEMSDSKLVKIASHSYNHKDLSLSEIDLNREIIISKDVLEEKLNIKVDSFILPFGRYNKKSLNLLKDNYKYIFKVGQGINKDFNGVNGLIYRVDADNIKNISTIFSFKNMLKYRFKSFIKSFYDGISQK
jgi:peptidoglycan/xylan/chitin deacetylase (PgdA/CDA1 family)